MEFDNAIGVRAIEEALLDKTIEAISISPDDESIVLRTKDHEVLVTQHDDMAETLFVNITLLGDS